MLKRIYFSTKKAFSQTLQVDLRSLSFFRISLGLVVLIDLINRSFYLETFYTDFGNLPRWAATQFFNNPQDFSIHFISGNLYFQAVFFAINIILVLLFTFGFKTRLVTFLCWIFNVSLHNRHPALMNSGDVLMHLALFWGIFLPLNKRWSLDSLKVSVKENKQFFSLGVLALALQISYVYICSAIFKNGAEWVPDGTAILYTLNLDRFSTPLGSYLTQYPEFLKILTYKVYYLELLGPLLLFIPFYPQIFKLICVFSFWGLHLGIFLTMNIGVFPWVCIAIWSAFLPQFFWDKIESYLSNRYTHELRRITFAFHQILKQLKKGLCEIYYVCLNQKLKSITFNTTLCFLIVYVFLYNIDTLPESDSWIKKRLGLHSALKPIGKFLDIDQKWNMFSPKPPKFDGWFLIKGETIGHDEVGLWNNVLMSTPYRKPANVFKSYGNQRWRKYLINLLSSHHKKYRLYFGKHLCRSYNRERAGNELLKTFTIDYIQRETSFIQTKDRTRYTIWKHNCFAKD